MAVLVAASKAPQSLQALTSECGRTNRTKFRDGVLRALLKAGLLEMTVPDKPRSSRQRYRTTAAGVAATKKEEEGRGG